MFFVLSLLVCLGLSVGLPPLSLWWMVIVESGFRSFNWVSCCLILPFMVKYTSLFMWPVILSVSSFIVSVLSVEVCVTIVLLDLIKTFFLASLSNLASSVGFCAGIGLARGWEKKFGRIWRGFWLLPGFSLVVAVAILLSSLMLLGGGFVARKCFTVK